MEKRKISPWLIAFRILFTLGLIWTVFFIFSNSLQIAAESSARSQEAMAWVNDKLAILSLGPLSEHVIRKLAHFAEYCLLGFFAMLCLRVYTRHFVRHISWPLFSACSSQIWMRPSRSLWRGAAAGSPMCGSISAGYLPGFSWPWSFCFSAACAAC